MWCRNIVGHKFGPAIKGHGLLAEFVMLKSKGTERAEVWCGRSDWKIGWKGATEAKCRSGLATSNRVAGQQSTHIVKAILVYTYVFCGAPIRSIS